MGTHRTVREVRLLIDRSEYTIPPGLEGDIFVYQNPITEETFLAFTPDDTEAHWFQHYMDHVGHELPRDDDDPFDMLILYGNDRDSLDEGESWFVEDDFELIED